MIRLSSALLGALWILSPPAAPQDAEFPSLPQRLDGYLRAYADAGHLSGTVLVAKGGDVLFERSYGRASYELDVPCSPRTRFNVASVTKPMTIAVVVQLIVEERIGLEDPLGKYLPEFPRGDEITINHLLNHRAGIPHRVTSAQQERVPHTAAEMVELAKRKPLLFEPGEKSVYSSAGYSVLARVVEIVEQKPFSAVLRERLFEPLGMDSAADVSSQELLPGRASCYFLTDDGPINAPLQDMSFLVGAGSVWATARDLFLLARGVVDGRMGEQVTASLMRSDGLHWNGATLGFRAFVENDRATDTTLVLVANLPTGANDRIREDLPRIVAGESIEPQAVPAFRRADVSQATLKHYEGIYELRPGSPMELRVEPGGLVRMDSWVLVPTGKGRFYSLQDYQEITVQENEDGEVTALAWGGFPMPKVGELPDAEGAD